MMSETASSSAHSNVSSVVGEAKCRVTDPNGILCGESESLGILKEFQRLYAERLRRLDGDSELAMHTLKSWVHDLTEQNTMLVQTVEELERELLKRVDLMHDQLRKTSSVIERNESLAKREKSEVEINLRHQVRLLQNDVSSLVDIISQAKEQGYCSGDNAKLHTVSQIVATPPKREIESTISPSNTLKSALKEFSVPHDTEPKKCFNSCDVSTQTYISSPHSMGDGVDLISKACSSKEIQSDCNLVPPDPDVPPEAIHASNKENDNKCPVLNMAATVTCDPCSQMWHSNSEKVYETCLTVPSGPDRIIICALPLLEGFSNNSINNVLVSSPTHGISHYRSEAFSLPCLENNSEGVTSQQLTNNRAFHLFKPEIGNDRLSSTSALKEETYPSQSNAVPVNNDAFRSADALSCDYSDSLESIAHITKKPVPPSVVFNHVGKSPVEETVSAPPMRTSDAVTESQSGIKDVDNLESQIAHKDAEIHSLLERIEEMQDIFSMTSKQIQQAVEAEHKSMKEIVANYEPEKVNLQTSDGKFAELNEALPSWVQERLKQQREQVNSLVSKLRELESSFIFVKAERDRLADDQKAPAGSHTEESKSVSHTSTDPSIIIASKELESTRQQLGEATKHVQSLASCVNDLEKKNRETQAALTVEVAEKHDQMLELRRELHQVEEQVKNANMQTHFKDNIIREMRNELKKYQAKISSESGSDLENKLKRGAFPTIPEVSSVSDSGVDDVDISSSTHSLQPEIDDLQLQLKDHLNQISEKDQELSAQRKALLSLEKEVAELRKTTSKATPAPQLPSITLRELEEYRLCTVEGQAAVEELRDEIEAIVTDLTTQEVKVADIERATSLYKEIIHNTQEILSQPSVNPVTALKALEEAQACIRDVHEKSEDFIRERQAGEQRRAPRERKVDKLQEQLDASHDNMRDAVENMEQALAERYEADRLSQQNFSDGSSYHSCKDSDSSNCLRQEMDRLEENNAELVSNLNGMERQKREAETKATQYFRELEKIRDQIARKSFTEELLHTKEQTICELQGALDSTRRQMRDLQSELERAARERDNVRMMLEQQSNTGPLQVAELQSELARLRNQMSTLNSKQALVDQYERRLKDSSDQAEKLSSQLNTLALNLQAKETMLSNKEEMIVILQDTLERTREELKLLKDKSGGASSSMDKPEQDEATANAGGVSDEVSGSSSVWGWTRNTATRKHRVHDV